MRIIFEYGRDEDKRKIVGIILKTIDFKNRREKLGVNNCPSLPGDDERVFGQRH